MRTFWHLLKRTVFWSYERGTWQYDVAVVMIVVFVLATPRSWFRDEPQLEQPAVSTAVTLLGSDAHTQTYRVDAHELAPRLRPPELANDLHNALQRAVPELQGRGFAIIRIEPVRDSAGTVVSYEVQIKR